jgi:RimJ/RimL family protein N-acetyltransferase
MQMIDSPVGPGLPATVLKQAQSLPTKPAAVVLKGKYVSLRLLNLTEDVSDLFAFSNGSAIKLEDRSIDAYDADQMIWRYMSAGPFAKEEDLSSFLKAQVDSPNGLCFCVLDSRTFRPIGVANYANNFPAHLKIELANIWYSPVAQRTKANLESTYLMLQHAFSKGYRRVEWKCDAHNERSRKAALRMGFSFEGIQESHFIIKGRNRDTAWFRILDREWNDVQLHLQQLLNRP